MNTKKVFAFALSVLFLIAMIPSAFAAKSTAQKVIESKENNLILATISDVGQDFITVEVFDNVKRATLNTQDKNTFKGNIPPDTTINIQKFKYSYCEEHSDSYNTPKIGDNIFISIQTDGNTYKVSGCAYKVDTVDVKTINFLVPAPMKAQKCMYDITAISYFVASNGMPLEFVFEEDAISIKHKDGISKIYPQADFEMPIKYIDSQGRVVSGTVESKDVINYDSTLNQPSANLTLTKQAAKDNAWVFSIIIIVSGTLIGLVVALAVRSRKFTKKRKGN